MSNNTVTYIHKAYTSIQDLTGNGIEYLVENDGSVRAIFIDGMFNGRDVRAPLGKTLAHASTINLLDNVLPIRQQVKFNNIKLISSNPSRKPTKPKWAAIA